MQHLITLPEPLREPPPERRYHAHSMQLCGRHGGGEESHTPRQRRWRHIGCRVMCDTVGGTRSSARMLLLLRAPTTAANVGPHQRREALLHECHQQALRVWRRPAHEFYTHTRTRTHVSGTPPTAQQRPGRSAYLGC